MPRISLELLIYCWILVKLLPDPLPISSLLSSIFNLLMLHLVLTGVVIYGLVLICAVFSSKCDSDDETEQCDSGDETEVYEFEPYDSGDETEVYEFEPYFN